MTRLAEGIGNRGAFLQRFESCVDPAELPSRAFPSMPHGTGGGREPGRAYYFP